MSQAPCHIGTTGWNHSHWSQGHFYPRGLRNRDWLSFYGQQFPTVEVSQTFYGLPPREQVLEWKRAAPAGFQFAVLVSQRVTHVKRLLEPQKGLERFLLHVAGLGEKLGPLLFQFPPVWEKDLDRFGAFLDYLKNQRVIPRLRAAFEFLNPTWYDTDVFRRLETAGYGLCQTDNPGVAEDSTATTGFVYLRRGGPGGNSSAGYPAVELQGDAERIRDWLGEGREVFVYFSNDRDGYALRDAQRLRRILED